jgi:hypothetical protein
MDEFWHGTGSVLAAGEHPAAVHRRAAAVRNPGHRLLCPVRFCQRVVVDQDHVVPGVSGGRGLRREVLVRTAGAKRIGGHEEQHHASMGNCRLRQGADHETRRRSSNSPRAERRIGAQDDQLADADRRSQITQFGALTRPVLAEPLAKAA